MLAKLIARLFVVVDPLGSAPIFLALLKRVKVSKARAIVWQEMLIALLIMLAFVLCGERLLSAMGVQARSLGVSGGIVLFVMAVKMLFPREQGELVETELSEPFIFPLAFPLIAGPSVLAVLIEMSHKYSHLQVYGSLLLTWSLSTAILLLAVGSLKRYLNEGALAVCERIMGLLLLLFATQMILGGIGIYFEQKPQNLLTPQIR